VLPAAILGNVANIRANYYGKYLIDDNIGYILEAFEKRGWLDDLFVIFLSDHGEMLGDHGRIRKSTFHEASVRIPLSCAGRARIPANEIAKHWWKSSTFFRPSLRLAKANPRRDVWAAHCGR
jgi:membrane-anchored protein YejM (alkaline phosphatase superfamily)